MPPPSHFRPIFPDPPIARRHERQLFLAFTAFLDAMVWMIFYEPTMVETALQGSGADLSLFLLAQAAIVFNLAFGWRALSPEQSKVGDAKGREPKPHQEDSQE